MILNALRASVRFKQSLWHLVGGYRSFGIVNRTGERKLLESLARWELQNEFLRQGFVANPNMWGPVAGTGTLVPD
jgi:hypothetical protein